MIRAIRGAVQVEQDTTESVTAAVTELMTTLFTRNEIAHDDLISILFTATPDLVSAFPAAAARTLGLGDVPLLCAQELSIIGSMPRVIRVLVQAYCNRDRSQIEHIYLGGAAALRQDLAQ